MGGGRGEAWEKSGYRIKVKGCVYPSSLHFIALGNARLVLLRIFTPSKHPINTCIVLIVICSSISIGATCEIEKEVEFV